MSAIVKRQFSKKLLWLKMRIPFPLGEASRLRKPLAGGNTKGARGTPHPRHARKSPARGGAFSDDYFFAFSFALFVRKGFFPHCFANDAMRA
jgi:hypothetical protein